ncbi:hypothetical protein LCGC14_1778080, partial [marine sediment metagenome]
MIQIEDFGSKCFRGIGHHFWGHSIRQIHRQKGKAQLVSVEYTPISDPSQDLEEKALLRSDLDQVKAALANIKEEYR